MYPRIPGSCGSADHTLGTTALMGSFAALGNRTPSGCCQSQASTRFDLWNICNLPHILLVEGWLNFPVSRSHVITINYMVGLVAAEHNFFFLLETKLFLVIRSCRWFV